MPAAPPTSLIPLPAEHFGYAQARHLLQRAGFGGSHDQLTSLVKLGLPGAVDLLVDYDRIDDAHLPAASIDPNVIHPPTDEEKGVYATAKRAGDQDTLDRLRALRLARQAEDRQQFRDLATWWLSRLIATPRPLQEKLTLLWHSHFASNFRTVDDAYLMYRQNVMFRENARRFDLLARGIVHDPAMIKFLDNDRNRRKAPNENLARELMELFTLGEGQYSEDDIKQGARALTGYTYDDNDFSFRKRDHDEGDKSILGVTGPHDGDDFVTILLGRRSCAQFVAFKLYRHFVADLPAPSEIDAPTSDFLNALADDLTAAKFDLTPVLKRLFMSRHFYHDAVVGNQIKSPAQVVAGTIRMAATPVRDPHLLRESLGLMGQDLFNPPSVAGWDGGRSWINTSTLFVRQNVCTYLITGKLPFADGWTRAAVDLDPLPLLAGLERRTPAAVADRLLGLMLAGAVPLQRRQALENFLLERDTHQPDTLIAALLLITAMPEYQLC